LKGGVDGFIDFQLFLFLSRIIPVCYCVYPVMSKNKIQNNYKHLLKKIAEKALFQSLSSLSSPSWLLYTVWYQKILYSTNKRNIHLYITYIVQQMSMKWFHNKVYTAKPAHVVTSVNLFMPPRWGGGGHVNLPLSVRLFVRI
jgi:hypothetical protein